MGEAMPKFHIRLSGSGIIEAHDKDEAVEIILRHAGCYSTVVRCDLEGVDCDDKGWPFVVAQPVEVQRSNTTEASGDVVCHT